jgi:hypothetical protein
MLDALPADEHLARPFDEWSNILVALAAEGTERIPLGWLVTLKPREQFGKEALLCRIRAGRLIGVFVHARMIPRQPGGRPFLPQSLSQNSSTGGLRIAHATIPASCRWGGD